MTPVHLREVFAAARKEGWRPLYPRARRDGEFSWVNRTRVRGMRRFPSGTVNIIVGVVGTRAQVDIRVLQHNGWVGIARFHAPGGDVAVNILVDFGYLPQHLHSGWRGR